MAIRHGQMQRSTSRDEGIGQGRLRVRALREEKLGIGQIARAGREMKRGPARVQDLALSNAVCNEKSQQFVCASDSAGGKKIQAGPSIAKKSGDLKVVSNNGFSQGSSTERVGCIQIRSSIEQYFHDRLMAGGCGEA